MSIKGDTGRAIRVRRGSIRTASLALAVAMALSLTVGCAKIGEVLGMFKFKQANQAYVVQDYVRAVDLYEETISNDPNNAIVYFYLGNSYDNLYKPSDKGDPVNDEMMAKAVANYHTAVDKLDRNDQTEGNIRNLAMQFLMAAYGPDKLDDPVSAEPVIIGLIQDNPGEPANYFQLGKLYEDAAEYEAAEQVYVAAKTAKPKDPAVYMQLAGYYSRQDNFPMTIDAYQQRAAADPSNPEGFYTIATQYWDQAYRGAGVRDSEKKSHVELGIVAIDRAIEIRPDYVEAIVYKNLLLRLQANLETNPATQQALIRQADTLRDQAEEIRKHKATGEGD